MVKEEKVGGLERCKKRDGLVEVGGMSRGPEGPEGLVRPEGPASYPSLSN